MRLEVLLKKRKVKRASTEAGSLAGGSDFLGLDNAGQSAVLPFLCQSFAQHQFVAPS
jgi:hypothetical protein